MGGWIERDREFVLYNTTPYASPFSKVLDRIRDLWEYDYRIKSGDIVVDLGAGVGDEALAFSHAVGPTGRVIAIEAHPDTYRRLASVVAANKLRNVTTLQLAVSDSDGSAFLTDRQNHLANKMERGGAIRVKTRSLDSLLHEEGIASVDLVKVNIEGAEIAALQGAPLTLQIAKNWAIECHDFLAETSDDPLRTSEPVIALLKQSGLQLRFRHEETGSKQYYVYASRPCSDASDADP
jgi:FkbM family methyltransferase